MGKRLNEQEKCKLNMRRKKIDMEVKSRRVTSGGGRVAEEGGEEKVEEEKSVKQTLQAL